MTEQNQKIDNISWPVAWLMGLLFTAGISLAGSDFVGFPWGQVIGVGLLLVMVIVANWVTR